MKKKTKPFIAFPNDAVATRFRRLNEEVSYRQRLWEEIGGPIADALDTAKRARLQAARELGFDPSKSSKFAIIDGKGVAWEDEEFTLDSMTGDLVPRDQSPSTG